MSRGVSRIWVTASISALLLAGATAQAREAIPTGSASNEAGSGAQIVRRDGLLPVRLDLAKGRIVISLPPADSDGVNGRFLYMTTLKTGLGSGDLPVDAGGASRIKVLVFRRIADKVVAEYENPQFTALGGSSDEQRAVHDSFAVSTAWVGKVDSVASDGRVLVDISGFLISDAMGISGELSAGGEKGYRLAPELSVADPAAVKVFPENIEFEARQTFISDAPGPNVSDVTPDPRQITVTVQHSLIKLPGPGFKPRGFDPRSGGSDILIYNFAAPLDRGVRMRLAERFRLEKTDPAAALSPVKKPIVFYLDRGTPEPMRTALLEGARWWTQAFEAAGFKDAFRVEMLPEGADPMDVRYSVIHWVGRGTRGPSWGQSISDPRTGEIIKGSIRLAALRVRQDMLFYEALAGADQDDTGGPNDPVRLSVARLRALAAHEVGHGLGFSHNFGASSLGRTSVMDYYPPRIRLTNGRIDLSDDFNAGLGDWDRFMVDWLYGEVPAGPAGEAILAGKAKAAAETLRFVKDADADDPGSGHAFGAEWDEGGDPIAELNRKLAVRRVALDQFGERALHPGEALEVLRRKFVPVYLLHRNQAVAVTKLIGGVDYGYGVKGDRNAAAVMTPPERQRAAIAALMAALAPETLDTPERLISLLSSGQSGRDDRQALRDVFATSGGPIFDSLLAADVGAMVVLDPLTAPDRLNRLVDQHRRDERQPSVSELAQQILAAAFLPASGRYAEIARRVQTRAVLDLAAAADDPKTSTAAVGEIEQVLAACAQRLRSSKGADPLEQAHRAHLASLLQDKAAMRRVLTNPSSRPDIPPS